MKIVFAGTPEFAARALDALIGSGHEVVLVLTQPDRPAGRGMKLQPSPVKQRAELAGIPVYQPERLKTPGSWLPIQAADADLMVVVAYGLILPQAVLDIPRQGCLNVHASLLPRWRGAAPIHRAIEAGDAETGVCIMRMEAGLDTGPVLSKTVLPLDSRETTLTLHDRLAEAGATLLCETLRSPLGAGEVQAEAGVTYAHKISKTESLLNWQSSAEALDRKVRAFNPFPGAAFAWEGEWIKVWSCTPQMARASLAAPGTILAVSDQAIEVACGEGSLLVSELQRPGGKRLSVSAFCAGHEVSAGMCWV